MSPRAVSLAMIFVIVAAGVTLGFLAGVRRKMSLEQWTVGARGFGVALTFLLMAGEIYTTASFLGSSGWVYSKGGPALYLLVYLSLGAVVSFFTLPQIWELGRRFKLQTQSDFFHVRYGNRFLAAFVCLVGAVALVPYLQLQIVGLGIIVNVASFDAIARESAMIVSVVLLTAFVLAGGVRAVAWVSVLKDFLMVVAALSVGIGIPYIHYGGIAPMFAALRTAHPAHLTMPGGTTNYTHSWFITTVLLTSFGSYCCWPHSFGATFAARSSDALRRNAMLMPLYTITLGFIFIAGFTAVTIVPGLKDVDLAMLTLVRKSFPPWFLGVIGGAGALMAMVPASILTMSAATLLVKNLWRPMFSPGLTDDQVAGRARGMVVVVAGTCLYGALHSSATLLSLLLLGYALVTQFFPGVILGLYWEGVSAAGIFAGMVLGVGIGAALILSGHDPVFGWNAGFVGLCVNFAVVVAVSLMHPGSEKRKAIAAVSARTVGAIIAVLAVAGASTGCGLRGERAVKDAGILLYTGTGTSHGDVDAIEAVLGADRLEYETAGSTELNRIGGSRIRKYRLLIVPGGNFVDIGSGLDRATTANIRSAVEGGLNYLGICAGAFFAGDSPYNGLNLTSGVRFGFYAAEAQGVHKTAVPVAAAQGTTLEQYWEDGPQLSGWGAVIAKYPDGTPAVAEGAVGSGWVVLSGVHPEAPAAWRHGMTFNTPVSADNEYAGTLIRAALDRIELTHY